MQLIICKELALLLKVNGEPFLLGFCVGEAKGTTHFSERSLWLLTVEGSLEEAGDHLGGYGRNP